MCEPIYFTIPSIGDDLTLDCRLYHPADASKITSRRRLRGAVIAHPYAPLGGCYDDPVVLTVKDTLLDAGYVVSTFNFRGAGDSAGRPSWTGQPETEDYTTVAGFLIYYIRELQYAAATTDSASEINDPFTQHAYINDQTVTILLSGYSFGSLILARLPPVSQIIERFEGAEKGTAAAEVFLRANTLARRTHTSLREARRPSTPRGRSLDQSGAAYSPKARSSPVTMGGEETDPSQRRRGRESRRSSDMVPHRIKTHVRRHSGSGAREVVERRRRPSIALTSRGKGPMVETAYLLISPVLLPLTTMLLPPGVPTNLALPFGLGSGRVGSGAFPWNSRTMLVFGSGDNFTSAKRLKQWGEKKVRQSSGALQWSEVDGAGHFWREAAALQLLSSKITSWDASNFQADEQ